MFAIERVTTSSLQRSNRSGADVSHFCADESVEAGTVFEKKRFKNRSKGTGIGCQTTSCQHTEQKEDAKRRNSAT